MSKELGELIVKECKPEQFQDEGDIVFSGLDSDVAGEAGAYFLSVKSGAKLTTVQKWPS